MASIAKNIHSHMISVLVENQFGVLARISGLFAARGFNIHSLAVGETHDPSISRITLVVRGEDTMIEQVQKQLNKLVEVIKVANLTEIGDFVDRELVLVKVAAPSGRRGEIIEVANLFKAKTVDVTAESLTLEIVGAQDKIVTFLQLLEPYGIMELARTGRVALMRGPSGMHSSIASATSSRIAG
jgi:acetolactate synthase-1/3 small subunit